TFAVGVVYPMFLVSVLVLGTFLTTGSPGRVAFGLLVLYALTLWLSRTGPAYLERSDIDPVAVSALLTTLIWALFIPWYLRSRRVVSSGRPGPSSAPPETVPSTSAAPVAREFSIAIHLADRHVWGISRKVLPL